MLSLDEQIARSLRESQENGELKRAKNWGKPFDATSDLEQTPEEFRLAFKMLKNAGYIPPEVENLKTLEALRQTLQATSPDDPAYRTLQSKIAQLQLSVAVRLESMRKG